MMIDALYNYRQGDIHAAEFSDEFNKLCIPFEEALSEEQTKLLRKLQTRFSSLEMPVIVERSGDEASTYAQAEWIKVYGALFDKEDEADKLFQEYTKNHKNKKVQ